MRLAVFTSQFPSKVSTFFARDIRALIDAGVEIDIFPIYPLNPSLWKYVPEILNENIFPINRVQYTRFADGIRALKSLSWKEIDIVFREIALVSYSAIKFGVKPFLKSMYVLVKALAWHQQHGNDYDHILSYWGNYAATCAYVCHRLTNKPIPFSIFLHAGTDLYRDQVYLKQKLLYADNIFVVCEFNKKFIHNLYPEIFELISQNIHVHHLGLDFAEFQYEPNGRMQREILAVGRLEKRKGFAYLLQAIKQLQLRGIEAELELIGDGDDGKPLKLLAHKLQIEKQVKFKGWLTFREVQTAMRRSTVLVHPSSEIGDAVPTVIKEAIALGTPVVASDVAGIPELLDYGKCGILVPPKNVEAITNALEILLRNEKLRYKYADAARKYAEKYFDLWRNGRYLADILRLTTRNERDF